MSGGLLRGAVAAALVAGGAWPFVGGFRDVGVLAAALLVTGLVFSALHVVTGVWADTFDQHSYLVDAARAGATGFHETAVGLSLPAATAVAVAVYAVAARLVATGWRLRP